MRDQNLPPPMNNMLIGIMTSTYLHEGSKSATLYEKYVDWGNNINFIFVRDQNSPPPMNNMLIGVITSLFSSDAAQRQGCSEYVSWGASAH